MPKKPKHISFKGFKYSTKSLDSLATRFVRENPYRDNHKFRNHLNKKRFPSEEWFKRILRSQQIMSGYERNYWIGPYFIDFYFPRKKLAIEIDGKDHEKRRRQQFDLLKDEYLEKQGINVIRIKHLDNEGAICVIKTYLKKQKAKPDFYYLDEPDMYECYDILYRLKMEDSKS